MSAPNPPAYRVSAVPLFPQNEHDQTVGSKFIKAPLGRTQRRHPSPRPCGCPIGHRRPGTGPVRRHASIDGSGRLGPFCQTPPRAQDRDKDAPPLEPPSLFGRKKKRAPEPDPVVADQPSAPVVEP